MAASLHQQLPRTALAKVPRQQRSVVHAILDAAKRILETEGLLAFNTNRVAQVAGVSVGSLYQYFPNIQGTYEGWTFTPTAEETSGVFFVAPVEAP